MHAANRSDEKRSGVNCMAVKRSGEKCRDAKFQWRETQRMRNAVAQNAVAGKSDMYAESAEINR
jgi:hypothetical protein